MADVTTEGGSDGAIPASWWDACLPDGAWDDEVRAINRVMPAVGDMPKWALRVRADMPKWGFEMCAHRWLDGLDAVVTMIARGEHVPNAAGHCGDVPSAVTQGAEARAAAVQRWLDARAPNGDALAERVAGALGDRDPAKAEAAACFVQLVRTGFLHWETLDDVAAKWREREPENSLLREVFEGEGLAGHLHNNCGYKILDRLDTFIGLVGRETRGADERHGACNGQLRFVFRDDPDRFNVTRGVLWGLHAYLEGYGEDRLRDEHPRVAGAATIALRRLADAGERSATRIWLAASLLKTTKLWCERALTRCDPTAVPATATRLPDVPSLIGSA